VENQDRHNEQIASELKARIASLCDFEGDSLKGEMGALKKTLLENPAACSLLLDEDIGAAVAALRRMVGVAIATATASKKEAKPKAPKKLSAKELAELMATVDDSEF